MYYATWIVVQRMMMLKASSGFEDNLVLKAVASPCIQDGFIAMQIKHGLPKKPRSKRKLKQKFQRPTPNLNQPPKQVPADDFAWVNAEEDEEAADLPDLGGEGFDAVVNSYFQELADEALSEDWIEALPMDDVLKQKLSLGKVFGSALPSLELYE